MGPYMGNLDKWKRTLSVVRRNGTLEWDSPWLNVGLPFTSWELGKVPSSLWASVFLFPKSDGKNSDPLRVAGRTKGDGQCKGLGV